MEILVKKVRRYLEANCKKVDLHMIRRFPFNSCESSSLLLGKVLTDEFPHKEVYFVEGENSTKYEKHFWVEVDELTFDITADQFEKVKAPSYGQKLSYIYFRFDLTKRSLISEQIKTNDFFTSRKEEFEAVSKVIRTL